MEQFTTHEKINIRANFAFDDKRGDYKVGSGYFLAPYAGKSFPFYRVSPFYEKLRYESITTKRRFN